MSPLPTPAPQNWAIFLSISTWRRAQPQRQIKRRNTELLDSVAAFPPSVDQPRNAPTPWLAHRTLFAKPVPGPPFTESCDSPLTTPLTMPIRRAWVEPRQQHLWQDSQQVRGLHQQNPFPGQTLYFPVEEKEAESGKVFTGSPSTALPAPASMQKPHAPPTLHSLRATRIFPRVSILGSIQDDHSGRWYMSFCGDRHKLPQTGRLKTTQVYHLTVLEARCPNSRGGQGHRHSEGSRAGSSLPLPVPGFAGSPWPSLARSCPALLWWPQGLVLHVCLSPHLLFFLEGP